MHELPLVFFTVFTQSAVGAFILLLIGGTRGRLTGSVWPLVFSPRCVCLALGCCWAFSM